MLSVRFVAVRTRRWVCSVSISALCVLPLVVLSGCCPIPMPISETLVPEAVATVVDAETGEPIPDAEVQISRYAILGSANLVHTETETTDDNGVATFEEYVETEWGTRVYMHNPRMSWRVCVRHDDYETADGLETDSLSEDDYDEQDGPWEFTVELTPGESSPCTTLDDDADTEPAAESDTGPADVEDFSDAEE